MTDRHIQCRFCEWFTIPVDGRCGQCGRPFETAQNVVFQPGVILPYRKGYKVTMISMGDAGGGSGGHHECTCPDLLSGHYDNCGYLLSKVERK